MGVASRLATTIYVAIATPILYDNLYSPNDSNLKLPLTIELNTKFDNLKKNQPYKADNSYLRFESFGLYELSYKIGVTMAT